MWIVDKDTDTVYRYNSIGEMPEKHRIAGQIIYRAVQIRRLVTFLEGIGIGLSVFGVGVILLCVI